ncbi:hypothetical protein [Mucilaginibacter kameinonensis]|uniref:hypothetical protein n=1 Tax=Mucilaginibacter kameinonensis TaxID=452286 RepID=UPI0013CF3679|nr:hypothetical protein [Mucilaginibacter kameinonensis]
MKSLLCFLVLIVTLGASCKKNDNQAIKLSGTYAGTFQRKVSGSGAVSNVSLSFSTDAWNGESQTVKYPALSHGSFSTTGNKINFKNESVWTAEFDWSLILSGDYDIAVSGNKIIISKSYATGMMDVYTLSKQ